MLYLLNFSTHTHLTTKDFTSCICNGLMVDCSLWMLKLKNVTSLMCHRTVGYHRYPSGSHTPESFWLLTCTCFPRATRIITPVSTIFLHLTDQSWKGRYWHPFCNKLDNFSYDEKGENTSCDFLLGCHHFREGYTQFMKSGMKHTVCSKYSGSLVSPGNLFQDPIEILKSMDN